MTADWDYLALILVLMAVLLVLVGMGK